MAGGGGKSRPERRVHVGGLVDGCNIRKSKQAFYAQCLFRHINKAVRRESSGGDAWTGGVTAIRKAFLSGGLQSWSRAAVGSWS